MIARIDQKDLLDYVTGETDSSVAVKETAETIFDAVDTRDAKRARLDDDTGAAEEGDSDAAAAATAAAVEVEQDFLPKCSTVEDILAQVSAVDDTALGSALETAVGKPLTLNAAAAIDGLTFSVR